jgi:hypothetical protein
MGWVWNMMVSFSDEEFWDEGADEARETCAAIDAINAWLPHGKLADLTRGTDMAANLYGGGFKHFDIGVFVQVVRRQDWHDRKAVQLWVRGETAPKFVAIALGRKPRVSPAGAQKKAPAKGRKRR